MIFRPLMTITAVFAGCLGLLLIFAPQIYLSLYAVSYSSDMNFSAQRLAPAIIGVAGLLWIARDLPAGAFASSFAFIASLVWFGIAATGLYHYASGVAGISILVAALLEVFLGALFVTASRQIRHA